MASPSSPNDVSEQPFEKSTAFISVKELRKLLGKDAEGLDDNYLRDVSIALGCIASTLTENPAYFNDLTKPEEGSDYGRR